MALIYHAQQPVAVPSPYATAVRLFVGTEHVAEHTLLHIYIVDWEDAGRRWV